MTNATEYFYGAVGLGIFPIVGTLGNSLVCIAILTEKRLQNITNYFLCSLAIADLLVSLVVMPLALVIEYNKGRWIFDVHLCNMYCTLDVLSCSASIIHMSVVSFDRYWGISRPFRIRGNTPVEVSIRILVVWVVTALLAAPVTVLGVLDKSNIYENGACGINNGPFQLFGSVCAFLIPCIIMFVTYSRTVTLLKRQAQQCSDRSTTQSSAPDVVLRRCVSQRHTSNKLKKSSTDSSPTLKKDSTITTPTGIDETTVSLTVEITPPPTSPVTTAGKASNHSNGDSETANLSTTLLALPVIGHSDKNLSSPPGIRKNLKRAVNLLTFAKRTSAQNAVATEQKATKVLGVVFFCFIVCWLPFFAMNFFFAMCPSCGEHFPRQVLITFLWLGYISSTINPLIYTVFNKQFRRSFLRILRCGYEKKASESIPFRSPSAVTYGVSAV